MIRKMPLILAGMAAIAFGLPSQGATAAVASGSGATLQIVPSPNPGTFPTLLGVGTSSASDAWTVGYDADSTNSTFFSLAEHWSGSAWAVVSTPNPFGNENIFNAVADLSPTDAWAVGRSVDSNSLPEATQPLIEHWNGTRWSTVSAAADLPGATLDGVAAISATDAWAVGSHANPATGGAAGLAEHWDGKQWSIVPSPTSAAELTSVAAISSSDVWAIGDNGGVTPIFQHWDGKAWTAVPSPQLPPEAFIRVSGIAAVSSSDVWMVGTTRAPGRRPAPPSQTLTEHWDGHQWSIVPSPDPSTGNNGFSQVAAISSSDVWAVGSEATPSGEAPLLANWNGTQWNTVQAPVPSGTQINQLAAAAALPTGTLWAVGRSDNADLIINSNNG